MKNNIKNMTTGELKQEYICLCLGSMIYNADTKIKRDEIREEIEKREDESEVE